MSEKMLKWLKHKQGTTTTTNGQGEMSADNITDDPLATIQVHPGNANKKSKSKANEIYAVSRVNPLFEEDGKGLLFSAGNHSGSSGYDSGHSDEDRGSSSGPEGNAVTEVIVSSEARGQASRSPSGNSNHIVALGDRAGPKLFRDPDDYVIQHEAALVGPDGRPILQIVQQNTNYVRSIAVAVPHKRALSPIHEQGSRGNATRVNAIQVPLRHVQEDATGAGKLVHKDTRYVQSIRIGPTGGTKNQLGRFSRNGADDQKIKVLGRKPSVTFSERVDILVDGHVKVPRRLSTELDSIVTDSLLILTSKEHPFQHMNNWTANNGWQGKRVSLVTDFHNRRYTRSINGDAKSQNGNSSSSDNEQFDDQRISTGDLQAFASSLKKSRPVKQIVSGPGSASRSFTPSPVLDAGKHAGKGSGASSENEDHDNDERSSESSGSHQDLANSRPRTPRSGPNGRSPFGGIADHYAAAKEIAKEIESYSVGTTKSTKRSLVRDLLLSNRGRVSGKDAGGSSSSSPASSVNSSSQDLTVAPGPDSYSKKKGKRSNNYEDAILVHVEEGTGKKIGRRDDRKEGRNMLNRGEQQEQGVYVKVPIYDALPRAHHDDSDSGNSSTDRSTGEVRLEIGDIETGEIILNGKSSQTNGKPNDPDRSASYGPKPHSSSSSASSVASSESGVGSSGGKSGGNNSKVMLVSGDSQNVVVDLSAVPEDLRDAILAGTALITLPDGVKKRLEPGYTMIAIPPSNSSSSSELNKLDNSKASDASASSGGSGGEESPLAANKFGQKNKAQIWDVLQHQQISATLTSVDEKGKGFRGKDKKITTILPFHPTSNTSPDFTIEGHRLKLQMKKLQVGKKRRCYCRLFGMLFFLLTFLGILVALSLIYTRGQRYFGSV